MERLVKCYSTFEKQPKSFSKYQACTDSVDMGLKEFYCTNVEDIDAYFKCDILIYKWMPTDIPTEEHTTYSPVCDFARILNRLVIYRSTLCSY